MHEDRRENGLPVNDAERLRRLQQITDAALAHLQLDDLLAALLDRVTLVLDADTAAILLVDADTNELIARAAKGIEEEVELGVRIPVGQGFAGRIAGERRPVVLTDIGEADVLNPLLRRRGVRSLLGVPLIFEGESFGVLHVGSLTPREFTRDDIDLLQLAADRASIAIEHARVFEAERAAREQLEHVQAVTDAALGHLELEDLFAELLTRIRDILRADTCAILLADDERRELLARAALGIEEEVEQGVRVPLGRGFAGRVAEQRRPIILPDLDKADVWNPILREKGIKSMLGVPLIARDRAIGVLHVGTLTPRHFDDADVALLTLVADRVAVAIERARLHQELVELDQLKLNFVAIASHELRTPATSVLGAFATLHERGDELTPELRSELIAVGYEQAERLRRLLEQLLDLSRLDARAINVAPRPIVLRSVIDEVVSGMPGEVTVDVPADLAVMADPLVLERVLSNLIVNAARYGEPPVTINADAHDRHLYLSVEDHGPGVPAELQGRLFERFERGRDAGGSGLGLAIAQAYARAHGGDLVYAPAGQGARFELILPRT